MNEDTYIIRQQFNKNAFTEKILVFCKKIEILDVFSNDAENHYTIYILQPSEKAVKKFHRRLGYILSKSIVECSSVFAYIHIENASEDDIHETIEALCSETNDDRIRKFENKLKSLGIVDPYDYLYITATTQH